MRPALTEADRRLVLGALDLAARVARRYRSAFLDLDERRSAAFYGVCLAALDWPGDDDFRAYAARRARWQIAVEVRARLKRWRRAESIDDARPDGRDWFAPIEAADRTDRLAPLVALLSGRQQAALAAYCRGESHREIAGRLGTTTKAVGGVLDRAIARLRRAANPR